MTAHACTGCPSPDHCADAPATRCGFGRPPQHHPEPEKAATGLESIPMVLYCPACSFQHIDTPTPCRAEMCEGGCVQPEDCNAWTNPPHRSHLCHACGLVWRPADVATVGVAAVTTRGKHDGEWRPTQYPLGSLAIKSIAPPAQKRAALGLKGPKCHG